MNTRNIDAPWEEMGIVYFDGYDIISVVEDLETHDIFRFSCSKEAVLDCFPKVYFNHFTKFLINYFKNGRFELCFGISRIKFRLFNGELANGASVICRLNEKVRSVIWFHNGSFVKKIHDTENLSCIIKRNSYGTIITHTFYGEDSKRKGLLSILGQYEKH